jgi:4-hydroxyphenylpyruvate dioxygenase-like putative hemolysin
MAPNTPDSVLAKNIEKRGSGLDSICLEVENLDDTIAELKAKGIEAINRTEYHGHKIAFIHPRDAFGMLIEMIERA